MTTFRPYASADRAECLALFDQNCPTAFAPEEREAYAAFLDRSPAGYCVARSDGETGEIVGAFGLIDAGLPGRRRLNWILVASHAHRRGIGAAMMNDVRRRAQDAGVRVIDIAASHISAPFFGRFGARTLATLTDGWGPGLHRVDMEWRVADSVAGLSEPPLV